MTVFLPQSLWQEALHGWTITDCSIRSSTIVYLVARQDLPEEEMLEVWEHEVRTRLIVIFLEDEPEDSIGWQELESFSHPRCGVARVPVSQGMVVSRNQDGDVWVVGSGNEGSMEYIAPGKHPMTMRVKCIDGHAYSVGAERDIYKRINLGAWVKLDNGFPELDASLSDDAYLDITANQGFNDLDGFSESDIYAVGGKGDIWHYDGQMWTQQGFPSNMQLNTVTCAGDGFVYVTGHDGSLWRGRDSTWHHLHQGNSSIPWNDVLWFEDRLWLASDYQTRIWDGKEMLPITVQGQALPLSGHMDANDGLLVIADSRSVVAYQNGNWRTLVAPYDVAT